MDFLHQTMSFLYGIVFAVLATFGINIGTEEPKYQVIERLGDSAEIRQYPPRLAAEVTVGSDKSENPRREAFQILAGYIFGANKGHSKIDMTSPVEIAPEGEKIAMTSPVEINKTSNALVMRFFMPHRYSLTDLPKPTNQKVKLIAVPASTDAALMFSGSPDESEISKKLAGFLDLLKKSNWKVVGAGSTYYYNPPWTLPFLRRNEIVVAVIK
jgi:SOUL heme-binding protein